MPIDRDDPRLTAYALGELDEADDRAAVEALVADDPEARRILEEVRATAALLTDELAQEPGAGLASAHRETIEARLGDGRKPTIRLHRARWSTYALAASLLIATGWLALRAIDHDPALRAELDVLQDDTAIVLRPEAVAVPESSIELAQIDPSALPATPEPGFALDRLTRAPESVGRTRELSTEAKEHAASELKPATNIPDPVAVAPGPAQLALRLSDAEDSALSRFSYVPDSGASTTYASSSQAGQSGMAGAAKMGQAGQSGMAGAAKMGEMGGTMGGVGGAAGPLPSLAESMVDPFSAGLAAAPRPHFGKELMDQPGLQVSRQLRREELAQDSLATVQLASPQGESRGGQQPGQGPDQQGQSRDRDSQPTRRGLELFDLAPRGYEQAAEAFSRREQEAESVREAPPADAPREMRFQEIQENPFHRVLEAPQSTFSIDVDTASYAIVRRFLLDQNLIPPADAVRIEEMVNTFRYDYPGPGNADSPVYVDVEVVRCPWNAEHRLARVALQARSIEAQRRPPGNLVFLVDVSGSMNRPDKLPLLKAGLRMLVEQLQEGDHVAIVTYAGQAGLALESTPAERKAEILRAIDTLQAGGSTDGSAGIQMAYDVAARHFDLEGTNRVILATDGDFNVGVTDDDALVQLIAEKARSKVYLTVLGFGSDNLQDARMAAVAQRGDGNYHYIDSEREARKVLVEELTGTLVAVARDVKIQLDFNPAQVESYRLIGYESRLLEAKDFADDRKDAGEVGAGHSVTALYELVPAGGQPVLADADQPRFVKPAEPADAEAPESFVVRLRYKLPKEEDSQLREFPIIDGGRDYSMASDDTRFAAAVASFGMLLRGSAHRGNATYDSVLELAESALGNDPEGRRAEFATMVRKARELTTPQP